MAKRSLDIGAVSNFPVSKKIAADFRRTQEILRASVVLSEVIHHSGAFTYDDREMSLALADNLGIAPPKYEFKTAEDVTKWSDWWHPKVEAVCTTTKALNRALQTMNKRRR